MIYHILDWCIIRSTQPIPARLEKVDKIVLASWDKEAQAGVQALSGTQHYCEWIPFKARAFMVEGLVTKRNMSVEELISFIENARPFAYMGYPLHMVIEHLL